MNDLAFSAWLQSDEHMVGCDLTAMEEQEKIAKPWLVRRNGGRKDLPWRIVFSSRDETKAREHYALLCKEMRQGGVELVNPSGETVERSIAPRLRTKW